MRQEEIDAAKGGYDVADAYEYDTKPCHHGNSGGCYICELAATVNEQGREIARLREELGRAAVREGELREWSICTLQQIAILGQKPVVPRTEKNPPAEAWEEIACRGLLDALATPSPLADAGWEVLEAVKRLDGINPYLANDPGGRHTNEYKLALEALHERWDEYEALLEGRGGEED